MTVPLRILALWAASDFEEFFRPAFCDRPEYEVEIISGNRKSGASPYAVNNRRLASLIHRTRNGEFDLILCGNIWNTPWPQNKGVWTSLANAARFYTYKRSMLDTYWISRFAKAAAGQTPIAAIDLRDSAFVLPWDWTLLQSSTIYFKRELFFMPSRSLLPLRIYRGGKEVDSMVAKLAPLSYGLRPAFLNRSPVPMAERKIDLFMSGSNNSIRNHLRERCRHLSTKYRVEVSDGYLSDSDYEAMLQNSKLVVCTESFGCETWRQYEVAAMGAIPMLNWPFAQNYLPFEPDQHAIYFSMIGKDFERQVEKILSRPELLQKISTATHHFVNTNKNRKTIGDYVIKKTLQSAGKSS